MAETKRIEIHSQTLPDGIIVLKPVGTLDVFTFTELKKYIAEICSQAKVIQLVVDLTEVQYIASSGWSVLLSRRQSIRRDGGDLAVFGMSENLRRVYDSMKIDKMLPSTQDLQSAVQVIKNGPPPAPHAAPVRHAAPAPAPHAEAPVHAPAPAPAPVEAPAAAAHATPAPAPAHTPAPAHAEAPVHSPAAAHAEAPVHTPASAHAEAPTHAEAPAHTPAPVQAAAPAPAPVAPAPAPVRETVPARNDAAATAAAMAEQSAAMVTDKAPAPAKRSWFWPF